jgi:DNA mismatch repair protein MutS2
MNRHALQVLQLDEALRVVAGYASSPLGAEAVRALGPDDVGPAVEAELRRVDQMVGFLLRADDWAIAALPDLRAPLRRLAIEGATWEPPWFRDAAELLRSSRETRRVLLQHADHFPLLAEVGQRLVKLEDVEAAIRHAISDAGEVKDDASRELKKLRSEIRGARAKIVDQLERYMVSLPDRLRVSDASVSVREGRYVIPIRREGRGDVGGIVHDESATGATLFVEPPIAIELMNRLRGLENAEAREVQRILRELTDGLRPHRYEIGQTFEALIELDSLFARGRFALQYNGHRPEILPAGSDDYAVFDARHPLLLAAGAPVVAFDLTLGPGERTLLVSGPNTGGKTVLLKAIGLISVLAQAGVVPPVGTGTRLPLFRDFFADIGDEQSIEASLSTFSAHLKNLNEILARADHEALVLIDEMGSGTDPAEGAALAQAILTDLTRRGATTVATTHLGTLKALAGAEPGVVNASLQFDSKELRPTYRLVKGVPGRSYGLAIAKRLGFPEPVLASADAFLPEEEHRALGLLHELEEKERLMAAALAEAEDARAQALALRRDVEEREHEVRKREREAERRARQQARDLLLAARQEVDDAIREVREAAERAIAAQAEAQAQADARAPAPGAAPELAEETRRARRRVEEAVRRQSEKMPEEKRTPRRARADALREGTRVRIAATGATGTVLELKNGRATVDSHGVRLQVRTSGLEPLSAAELAAAEPAPKAMPSAWVLPEIIARPEVDLRGLRAEEVAGALLPALDAAIQADLASLRIIHGKGTGALREVVAELLRSDRRVKGARAGGVGEGGVGVTVAELS